MGRGSTGLDNYEYDEYLSSRAQKSRTARHELIQRKVERKEAHDGEGIGYHFGLGDAPVKITNREHFRRELDKRGLMLAADVKKDLRK